MLLYNFAKKLVKKLKFRKNCYFETYYFVGLQKYNFFLLASFNYLAQKASYLFCLFLYI